MQSIVLGGGCFWCLEAVFQRVNGVSQVVSGYSGGEVDEPDYKSVCNESTGHAEVVDVTFDDAIISLEQILEIFFTIHDPTTLNRQGNDIGTQYRSVVYYRDDIQKTVVMAMIETLQPEFKQPIVTEVKELEKFWPAENYHQNYFNENSSQPYCQLVVGSKVQKLYQYFSDYTKSTTS